MLNLLDFLAMTNNIRYVFQVIATYTEAVQTVDPKQAVGKIKNLWIEFAKFYEKNGQVEDARIIFEKATQVAFMKVDDLAR